MIDCNWNYTRTSKKLFDWIGGSIVSLALDPSARVASEQELSGLIVAEDEDGEGDGREPPVDLERVHPQTLVHPRGVREDGCKAGLEAKPKVHEVVLHALLEHRVLPCLTDDEIGPLHDDNRHKEGSVTGVLQDLSVPVDQLVML